MAAIRDLYGNECFLNVPGRNVIDGFVRLKSDPELLKSALSPRLATVHYVYYVALTPLIMMNLLIALM